MMAPVKYAFLGVPFTHPPTPSLGWAPSGHAAILSLPLTSLCTRGASARSNIDILGQTAQLAMRRRARKKVQLPAIKPEMADPEAHTTAHASAWAM